MRILGPVIAVSIIASPLAAGADASFGKDLKATIALQGKPCDQVTQSQQNSDSDYTVSCKDGNRYHVFVDPQGRVVVQAQKP